MTQQPQLQIFYAEMRKIAEINLLFMELFTHPTNPLTEDELAVLILRRPSLWMRFKGFVKPSTKANLLRDNGYIVGDRDARLNRSFPGRFMVAENYDARQQVPTDDGSNSPWCIVGDDLDALINEAFEHLAHT